MVDWLMVCLFHLKGYAHKCYQCYSTKSWEHCATKEVTCPGEEDHCVKVKIEKNDTQHFSKGCSAKSKCKAHESCKSSDPPVECKLHCCSGDLCNVATVPMVSAIMLLVCALVAFIREVSVWWTSQEMYFQPKNQITD